MKIGLHQGSVLNRLSFPVVMDGSTVEMRQEALLSTMFADEIMLCSESKKRTKENMERWPNALKKQGMRGSVGVRPNT